MHGFDWVVGQSGYECIIWVYVGCNLWNGHLDIWWNRSKKKNQQTSHENSKTPTKSKLTKTHTKNMNDKDEEKE